LPPPPPTPMTLIRAASCLSVYSIMGSLRTA
jgi:hypothetical protein